MSNGLLSFDDGRLTLDGKEVSGILQRISGSGKVRFDEAETDQLSGKVKTPLGWEDTEITVELCLTTEESSDCYDKLKDINAIFKGTGSNANPKIYRPLNRHIQARGVDQVVFSGLDSRESNRNDTITVTLHFIEHTPPIVAKEKRVVESDKSGSGSGSAPSISPANADDYVKNVEVG